MKTLYLIRHAKSSWSAPELRDFERPLNKRGKRDAPFMGIRLKNARIKPDFILSSPAKRAWETACIIAEAIDYPEAEIAKTQTLYLANIEILLKTIKTLDNNYHNVFLLGHNPGLTDIANFLTAHKFENIPTCGITGINFEINTWQEITRECGQFILFDYPRRHFE